MSDDKLDSREEADVADIRRQAVNGPTIERSLIGEASEPILERKDFLKADASGINKTASFTDLDPKAVIEALLFISEKPLLVDQIKGVLNNLNASQIRELFLGLKSDYENSNRGIRIEEIAGGFQMATSKEVAVALKKFYKQRDAQRLSRPALETLAIIAYKQPVTRLDIESFRGVNVDGMIKSLLEKGLIRPAGRKDIIGRPFVYATTRQFLEYFGLNSLEDLPKIEDFVEVGNGFKRAT